MNEQQPSRRIRIDPIHTSFQGFSRHRESTTTEIVAIYFTDTSMQTYEIVFTTEGFMEHAKALTHALEIMKEHYE